LGETEVIAVGTTGSARFLAGVITGADMVKNEISAHAVATIKEFPDVSTIFEIGGQDSKIIIIRDRVVVDFAMNTVCAAGTGSFLDHQAERLGIKIEEFGDYALRSKYPVRIAGRCTVFAESDMIHKQQMGASVEDIIRGLSESLVRNYLNNVGRGKELLPRFVFQGGVSENKGIKKAFEEAIGHEIYIPKHNKVMGAIGAAILAHHEVKAKGKKSNFRGFEVVDKEYYTRTFYCNGCSNNCEIYEIREEGKVLARWGDRCGRWTGTFQVHL
ncbi:MAG TPA: 2-hydroxyglutaryl-CoA dehydratase, partial [Candidatus Atribacteria bacterium]|nr:2-hydroxyglutaryl-CoA dehydratase [Candidatus Atribacteria bacterium]